MSDTDYWQQLQLTCNQHIVDDISDFLTEHDAVSVTWQNADDSILFEPKPDSRPVWEQIKLTALFKSHHDLKKITENLLAYFSENTISHLSISKLKEQDWENVWMEHYKPVQISKRLWICPTWETPPDPEAINILLDPGLAFGTGTHPTTAMCLAWLDEHIQGGETVIDFGCGSGILAIAALKLGCAKAIAIDIDPQALVVTRENAIKNGIEAEKLIICTPNQIPELTAEIVVANILANPLISLSSQIAELCKLGACLALSGLLAEQADSVEAAYKASFAFNLPIQKKDWVLLSAKKR